MTGVRIAICEDEKTQREFYKALCIEASKRHDIDSTIETYVNGNDLLFDLDDPKYCAALDLLLLDIKMPGIDGVQTAKEARKNGYNGIIVFVTASKEHYESAFDVGALNYITKGEHDWERFEKIFLEAVRRAGDMRQDVITLSGDNGLNQIEVRRIAYFEIIKGNMTVYCDCQETHSCTSTLEKLEKQLSERNFQRIHRNYLVSLLHIKSISFKGVLMQDGTELPVGRRYYPELKEAVEKLKI